MSDYHASRAAKAFQQSKVAKNFGVIVDRVDHERGTWTFNLDQASLTLRVLPGCCGIMLIYNLNGKEQHVLKLIKIAQYAAREGGFGLVLMTLKNSSPIIKKLPVPDWGSRGFKNPRTNNEITVLQYTVPQKPKKIKKVVLNHGDN